MISMNRIYSNLTTDYSQGDLVTKVYNSKETQDEAKGKDPEVDDQIQTDYFRERQRLSGSTDDGENDLYSDSWDEDDEIGQPLHFARSHHVTFKTPSKQSISELRKESRTLLSLRSPPETPDVGLNNSVSSDLRKTATIFDLCWEDRQRVGQLIGELASSQENIQLLQAELDRAKTNEAKYKQKSGGLMKRVDVLDEKSRRLESQMTQLKEKHLESLTNFKNQFATFAARSELSDKEIERLTLENQKLRAEAATFKTKASTLESKLKVAEETNAQAKILLEAATKREKASNIQIKGLSARLEETAKADKIRKKIEKDLQTRLKSETKEKDRIDAEFQKVAAKDSRPLISKRSKEIETLLDGRISTTDKKDTLTAEQKEKAMIEDIFFIF